MSEQPIRFLHASNFRLHAPLHGLCEPPVDWLDLLADAPYTAAQHVFATALSEEVDFVVLTGQLLDPQRGGPRGMVFLLSQFEQLAARDIAVYWAASEEDHWDQWPEGCELPSNVHVFTLGRVEEVVHHRNGEPVATVLGRSGVAKIRGAEYSADRAGFTVAAANGQADIKSLSRSDIDYWALGGGVTRETYFSKPHYAHDPGSPQGRSENERGPHGCTLVRVADGRTNLSPIACDAVRWHVVSVEAPRPSTLQQLEAAVDEQARRLTVDSDRPQLVVWQIEGVERLEGAGRDGRWRSELAQRLRNKHGGDQSGLWTVEVETALPDAPPEDWLEENSMLGDFLRELRDYDFAGDAESALEQCLAELTAVGERHEFCDLSDRDERQRVIREASKLGADLLRGKA